MAYFGKKSFGQHNGGAPDNRNYMVATASEKFCAQETNVSDTAHTV
jgi:hypothetical protein